MPAISPQSPTKILLVGATGYIGGSILSHISKSDPSAQVTALVRSEEDVEKVNKLFPKVKIVGGDLSNEARVKEAAANANVVIYAARNTQDGLEALLDGLSSPSQPSSRHGALFIMLSAIISLADPRDLRLGEEPPHDSDPTSDVKDAEAIKALPDHHWHVAQERAFFNLARDRNIQGGRRVVTPVVMGLPLALGAGAGPVRTEGFVHDYVRAVARRASEGANGPFIMGQGRNVWSWCTTHDIADAAWTIVSRWRDDEGRGWDEQLCGYYYVEAGQLVMRDVACEVFKALTGLEATPDDCDSLQYPQFAQLMPVLPGLWGVTARCKADRLRSMGWTPKVTTWRPVVEECAKAVV
ncbi:hypothetical protein PspLS_00238 [Pyricularia sp. CBS 133598]|nr:hypothetical protein PspLS_00238 [Pyricularia sp. CBS 133598]